jgi:hypothetical protein
VADQRFAEAKVRLIVEPWIENYNAIRPHEALQGLSPFQFAAQKA